MSRETAYKSGAPTAPDCGAALRRAGYPLIPDANKLQAPQRSGLAALTPTMAMATYLPGCSLRRITGRWRCAWHIVTDPSAYKTLDSADADRQQPGTHGRGLA
jgi:hypothetical protein